MKAKKTKARAKAIPKRSNALTLARDEIDSLKIDLARVSRSYQLEQKISRTLASELCAHNQNKAKTATYCECLHKELNDRREHIEKLKSEHKLYIGRLTARII